jgi:type IV secretory pathway VirB3-like protein
MALEIIAAITWILIIFLPIYYGIYLGIRSERERIRKLITSYTRISKFRSRTRGGGE